MRFFISLLLAMCVGNISAQTLEVCYRSMPDSLCPLLTLNNRLDLCDYLAANMKAEVRNRLGGTTEMTKLTPTYAHLQLTSSTEVEYEFLISNGDTTIQVTHTAVITDTIRHSTIALYDTKWKRRR